MYESKKGYTNNDAHSSIAFYSVFMLPLFRHDLS